MRASLIGASILLLVSSSFAAPKKKKKPPKRPNTTETDKNKGSGDEIEMDNPDVDTAKPEPAPTPTPTPAEPAPGPTAPAAAALAIDERPLTLPKRKIDLHGGLPIILLPSRDNMGNVTSSAVVGLTAGATYGIDDKTEIGGDYTIPLSPASLNGLFAIHVAHSVIHDAKMDLALAGALEVQPIDKLDAMGNVTTTTMLALELGAWFRYHIKPKLSVFTGLPALPHRGISLSQQGVALPPLGYQLNLGLNNGGPIVLELPIGASYQAAPNIYLYAATNLAQIKIANFPNQFLFKDFVPIGLGGYYAMPKLDVGVEFADDLKIAANYLSITFIGRYFLK